MVEDFAKIVELLSAGSMDRDVLILDAVKKMIDEMVKMTDLIVDQGKRIREMDDRLTALEAFHLVANKDRH